MANGSTSYKTKLKDWQRVFVNRSLNMSSIRAIGFDMDHTLAVYNRENFEALAFRETLHKFADAGYPEQLQSLEFKPNFVIRGLLVDMDRGNLLKVDGHKYVKVAYHGHSQLTKEERHRVYNSESYKASDLLSVDTFFALSEVQLFAEIVDFMNKNPGQIHKSFREVYQDLRRFIDLCHADGSIKKKVMAEPEQFFIRDKYLAPTLAHFIEGGKALWLLTNSGWPYTDCIMDYLFADSSGLDSWRDYFEYIIVGASKPGFFTGKQPFYLVNTDDGSLELYSKDLELGSVYHGGNAEAFQKLTGFRGDEILYVGDHIYGDIARSKATLNWRTVLIVEELEGELEKLEEMKADLAKIKDMLKVREVHDEGLQTIRSRIRIHTTQIEKARQRGDQKRAGHLAKEQDKLEAKLAEKRASVQQDDVAIRELIRAREHSFHEIWGELMKAGLERSRFADQVAEYACLYTSRVTNMRFYSPFKKFSSSHDLMPHEI